MEILSALVKRWVRVHINGAHLGTSVYVGGGDTAGAHVHADGAHPGIGECVCMSNETTWKKYV